MNDAAMQYSARSAAHSCCTATAAARNRSDEAHKYGVCVGIAACRAAPENVFTEAPVPVVGGLRDEYVCSGLASIPPDF
jgi:hypothetical protein